MEIVKNGNDVRMYIREIPCTDPEWIRKPTLIEECEGVKKIRYLCDSGFDEMTYSRYLSELLAFEEERKRNYQSKKMRYGLFFLAMLPKGSWDDLSMSKAARCFANQLRGENKGLKWVVWSYRKGKATYLLLWMADREKFYVPHKKTKVFTKTQYINKQTGKFCGKNDPDAEVLFKKGSKKEDGEIYTWFAEQKTRAFAYSTSESGKAKRQWLCDCLIHALKEFAVKIMEGFMLKRRKMKAFYNRWVKRCVVAHNRVQKHIEDTLNYYWTLERNSAPMSIRDELILQESTGIFDSDIIDMKLPTAFSRDLKSLYQKLVEIFEGNLTFVYQENEYRLKDCRCDRYEEVCRSLKKYFEEEMNQVLVRNGIQI